LVKNQKSEIKDGGDGKAGREELAQYFGLDRINNMVPEPVSTKYRMHLLLI
jgi:hypothetical protein